MRALVLIDIQTGFDDPFWGNRNNPDAEANAARLLTHARAQSWDIVHVRHVSTQEGSPLSGAGTAFKPEVAPMGRELVIDKNVNSAFIGTQLEHRLHQNWIKSVVMCGLTTPHCVSTTTRMAANLGFDVTVAHDACAAFARNGDRSWATGAQAEMGLCAQDIHTAALDQLHNEFATVRAVGDILSQ